MLLSLQKETRKQQQKTTNKQTNKQSNKPTTTKHTETTTTYSSPCLHHKWRCYQAIALNDQQVGSTSLMSNSNANSVSTPKRWSLTSTSKKRKTN